MTNKILIISGPTATGKTALASYFAKKYNGELVSTDSCQIYKGMDIGTGKDQPGDIPIHMIDIVTPDIKYSVSQFRAEALKVIAEIQSRGKLPILVGCSGLYTKAIISNQYNTFNIKPNNFLRFFLNKFSTPTLQRIYSFLDKKSFLELNKSDVSNPHRLIRKIEIFLYRHTLCRNAPRRVLFHKNKISPLYCVRPKFLTKEDQGEMSERQRGFDLLHLSLTSPLSILYDRIDARVQSRLDDGFLKEVKNLLKKYNWSDPGMQIGAYLCLKPYFDYKNKISPLHNVRPKLSTKEDQREILIHQEMGFVETPDLASLQLDDCLQKWRYAEHSDARRQGTFFKTQFPGAIYLDISSASFQKTAENLVAKWYN